MKDLIWNVYRFNLNKRKIETYNVFNHGSATKEIKEAVKASSTKEEFAEKVERICMYYFWCKCEWEVVVTSWPAYITADELCRLNKENDDYKKERGHYPCSLVPNLEYDKKLDVYSQLKLNWDNFIDYVWNKLN